MSGKFIFNTLEELNLITKKLKYLVKPNTIILLNGQLGSGKTTFVKYLLKHLHCADLVHSPSFVIVLKYQIQSKETFLKINHIDFYRLLDQKLSITEINELMIYLDNSYFKIIEWPLKQIKYKKYCKNLYQINIKNNFKNNATRTIELKKL